MKRVTVFVTLVLVAICSGVQSAQDPRNIREALGPGLRTEDPIHLGLDLLRHTIDQTEFPGAKCNDETPAIFYFRPHAGDAESNRWLIQLMGGGFCSDPKSCLQRWMGENPLMPNFDAGNMTSLGMPVVAAAGNGLMDRDRGVENPFANWNHVLVHYCSSDTWSGTALGTVPGYWNDPDDVPDAGWVETGERLSLPFAGRRIVNAVVNTLRRCGADGAPLDPLAYLGTELPDLDEAEAVVLAGGSAGGLGVINNLDHLNATLRTSDGVCANRQTPLRVAGLIDSAFPPALEFMDLESSLLCEGLAQPCTWDTVMDHSVESGTRAMWRSRLDRSCLVWHNAENNGGGVNQGDGRQADCGDDNHVLANHVTTPFFVRMGQTDELMLTLYSDVTQTPRGPRQGLDIRLPNSKDPITSDEFARRVRSQARALAHIGAPSGAEERASILVTPGAFVPTCDIHDTTRRNDLYDVTINNRGGNRSMFDVFRHWESGADAVVVASSVNDNFCG